MDVDIPGSRPFGRGGGGGGARPGAAVVPGTVLPPRGYPMPSPSGAGHSSASSFLIVRCCGSLSWRMAFSPRKSNVDRASATAAAAAARAGGGGAAAAEAGGLSPSAMRTSLSRQQSAASTVVFKEDEVRHSASFLEVSLCSSRACLGKMIVYIYIWLRNTVSCAGGRQDEDRGDQCRVLRSRAVR
jgi:hypothetical protein